MKVSEDLYSFLELKDILLHSGWLGDENNLSDYGLAFEPILQNLGYKGSIRQFVDCLPYQSQNLDLINFLNTMVNLGYKVNRGKVNLKKLDPRLTPCLFFPPSGNHITNEKRPWIITNISSEGYEIYFPEIKNSKTISGDELHYVGDAYFFREIKEYDNESETITRNIPQKPMAWFRTILFRFKGLFAQVILCNTISNMFGLASPLFVMYTYDRIIGSRAIDALFPIVIGALIAVGLDSVLRVVKGRLFSWFAVRIDDIVGQTIFEKLLFLPPRYTETASVSSQISRMRDFDNVRDFFSGNVGISLFEIPFTFIYFIALWLIGGPLALVPIFLVIVYAVLGYSINSKIEDNLESSSKSSSLKNTLLIETLTRLRSIRSVGAGDLWYDRFRMLSGSSSYNNYQQATLSALLEGLAYAFSIVSGLSTLVLGIFLTWNGKITPGELIASMMIIWKIISPFQTVCISLGRVRSIFKSITQVHRLLTIKSEVDLSEFNSIQIEMDGIIEFNQVGLKYTNDSNPVLSGFNLKINSGELVAVTGQNGTGKTSILKLISGMYNPQAGAVRIDGVDLRQLSPLQLRRSIGYIPQTPNLYSGTIAQNIRLADPTASEDKINFVLKKLEIYDELNALEDGINHYIANPKSFPFIQSFLISMARALVRESKILLIDELPPRILNSERGTRIMEFLLSKRGSMTIIFISNREEYLNIADKMIYLVGNGQAAFGKPEDLLKMVS